VPRLPCPSCLPLLLLLALLPQTGCANSPEKLLASGKTAYQRGDYYTAYNDARVVYAKTGAGPVAQESAYLAGICAHRLPDYDAAQRYLWVAAHSDDRSLAGLAYAELGLVYMKLQLADPAVGALDHAAALLQGQNQANAYYNEGLCLQKLGLWAQARQKLDLAVRASSDPAFRALARDWAQAIGFTLQLGAYSVLGNARADRQQLTPASTRLGLGPPQILVAADTRYGTRYLVRVGEFGNYDLAQLYRTRLGRPTAAIVPLFAK
jgi:tetratricopeptide (TPR) repeat protein